MYKDINIEAKKFEKEICFFSNRELTCNTTSKCRLSLYPWRYFQMASFSPIYCDYGKMCEKTFLDGTQGKIQARF